LDIKVLGDESGNGDAFIKKRFVEKFNEKTEPQMLHSLVLPSFREDDESKQMGHNPFTICNEIITSGDDRDCGHGNDWTLTFCCGMNGCRGGFCWGLYK
jgi:hypothetical protein